MTEDEKDLWNILMDFVKTVSGCPNCPSCQEMAKEYLSIDILVEIKDSDPKKIASSPMA